MQDLFEALEDQGSFFLLRRTRGRGRKRRGGAEPGRVSSTGPTKADWKRAAFILLGMGLHLEHLRDGSYDVVPLPFLFSPEGHDVRLPGDEPRTRLMGMDYL